jgi:hypothetical protein
MSSRGTPKQNWRYPADRWAAAAEKCERLGIDRSTYLTGMTDLLLAETDEQTRARLELPIKADAGADA